MIGTNTRKSEMAEKNVRVMPGKYEDTDSDQVGSLPVCIHSKNDL